VKSAEITEDRVNPDCFSCRFWERYRKLESEDERQLGSCRIRAPQSTRGFPTTDAEDWCGEFKARSTRSSPMPKPSAGELLKYR